VLWEGNLIRRGGDSEARGDDILEDDISVDVILQGMKKQKADILSTLWNFLNLLNPWNHLTNPN
jgi:hypothetical protein